MCVCFVNTLSISERDHVSELTQQLLFSFVFRRRRRLIIIHIVFNTCCECDTNKVEWWRLVIFCFWFLVLWHGRTRRLAFFIEIACIFLEILFVCLPLFSRHNFHKSKIIHFLQFDRHASVIFGVEMSKWKSNFSTQEWNDGKKNWFSLTTEKDHLNFHNEIHK